MKLRQMCYDTGMNKHVAHGHVLAADLETRLARVAERTGKSSTRLLETALAYFLDQVETEDEIRADLDESFRDYEETGLHLTNDEVMEWLKRVAAGEDVPPPKAHT